MSNSITRNYKITPTSNTGLNATAMFYYDDSELNNLTEADLGLYKSTDGGVNWLAVGGTLSTIGNYITATNIESFSKWSLFSTTNPPTEVEEGESKVKALPKVYALCQNYPNPFNPATTISFDLPKQSQVLLKIYDIIGREVAILEDEIISVGSHTKIWNASMLPSGVYFYRIDAHQVEGGENKVFTSTKKLLLVK